MPRGLEIIYGSQLGEFGVAKVDKIWILDPYPNIVHPWWDLWVVGKKPLCKSGAMMWASIKGDLQDYAKEKINFALYTRGQYAEEVLSCMPINSIQNGVVWETFCSIGLWVCGLVDVDGYFMNGIEMLWM